MSSNLSEFILDHPVSTKNDAARAVRELLEVLFADTRSANAQPKKAAEAEAEAEFIDEPMSISVEDNVVEHLEEPLGK